MPARHGLQGLLLGCGSEDQKIKDRIEKKELSNGWLAGGEYTLHSEAGISDIDVVGRGVCRDAVRECAFQVDNAKNKAIVIESKLLALSVSEEISHCVNDL